MEFLRVLSSVCRFHCPIHGPQALALFGFALILWSRRPGNRLSQSHRLAMITGAFVAYLGIVLLVTWQALRMQPITSPDALTLSVFAALVVGFVAYNALILRHAYRNPSRPMRTVTVNTFH